MMVKVDKVTGSKAQALPLVITSDMVYLHTGITYVEENMYTYTEYQTTLPDFLMALFSEVDVESLIRKLEVQD